MHLHHPSLSLNGKKKGKQKFRNAEEAKRARELEADWAKLQKKWGVEAEDRKRRRALSSEPLTYKLSTPEGRQTEKINSLGTGIGVATVSAPKVYTGDCMIGISQMAKSNAVPVFNYEHIIDVARMRR